MNKENFHQWLQRSMARNLEWFGHHIAPWLALAAVILLVGMIL